jgi:hypothetical protein
MTTLGVARPLTRVPDVKVGKAAGAVKRAREGPVRG